MDIGQISNMMRAGVMQVFILIAPVLGAALIVGLFVAIFQAMFAELKDYTMTLFGQISRL